MSGFPRKRRNVWAAIFLVPFLAGLSAGTAADPAALGRAAADNILRRQSAFYPGVGLFGPLNTTYPMVCSFYGVLIFSAASGEAEMRSRVEEAFRPFLRGLRRPARGHVDLNVFGIVPFELYRQTKNPAYLPLARALADDEFKNPRPDGLSRYSRFWVDDMYMIGSLQTQAYKSLGDPVYLDRAILQLLGYCRALQQANGLFHHNLQSPFFWGRGNGWAAASLTELLQVIPEDHPRRPDLLAAYRKLMKGLLACQDPRGPWHQLLDDPESYLETSATGMFVFALATGVRQGWLEPDPYQGAAEKAWAGLASFLEAQGDLRDVCIGTNARNNKTHYLSRPRKTGDLHGQAAFLWAATAMLLLSSPK